MTKLPSVSSEKIIKNLLKSGFGYASIKAKGSHTALVRVGLNDEKYLVIIPKGTLISIIKQSGYSRNEFIKLLD